MPQLGSYKALGSSLGKYKASQYATESKEYAKAFESFKGGQERSYYGAIGSTIANVIGISEELRKTKKLERFKDIATDLIGIEEQKETYRPLGFLPEKERTTYTSAFTGKPIDDATLRAIGKDYELTGESRYADIEEMEGPEGTVHSKGIVRRRAARDLGISTADPIEMNRLLDEHYFGSDDEFFGGRKPWTLDKPTRPVVPFISTEEEPDLAEPVWRMKGAMSRAGDQEVPEFSLDYLAGVSEWTLPMDLWAHNFPSESDQEALRLANDKIRREMELKQQRIRGETEVDVEIGPAFSVIYPGDDESPVEAFGAKMFSDADKAAYLDELAAEQDREQEEWYSGKMTKRYYPGYR